MLLYHPELAQHFCRQWPQEFQTELQSLRIKDTTGFQVAQKPTLSEQCYFKYMLVVYLDNLGQVYLNYK